MAKRMRVVTARDQKKKVGTPQRKVIGSDNPKISNKLTPNEVKARKMFATTAGGFGTRTAGDVMPSGGMNFYSPQLSTDFLEKPQNLRERRAFYRFFYNTNEIIGQAIDIHSTLPLSKLRLVPPKGKNKHQNDYVYKYFTDMCDNMKLFKTLIEVTHEYYLFGNCVHANSLIRTELGYKRAKDIQIDDKVLTHKNRWRKVIRTCSRKAPELIRVHTDGCFPTVDFSEEHPLEIVTDIDSNQTEYIKTGDIKKGQLIRFVVPKEPCSCLSSDEDEKRLVDFENKWRLAVSGDTKEPVQLHKGITYGEEIAAVRISETERIKGGIVYNFEVEEDNTYQVAGFSTHNCFIFAEEHDWKDGYNDEESDIKKEEAVQRSQLLKEKYDITDKNPLFKGWKKLLILPPDQVRVRKLPLTDDVAVEYMPDAETRKFLSSDMAFDPTDPTAKIRDNVSSDLREKVRQSGVIPLDTDPNTGSHVYHLARKKSQYEPLGVSIVERCINTLVLMDKLRQAQTSIASRHMTPMRVVWAEDLSDNDVDNLREQVDLALVDPDFSIIANYEIHWEEMGSNGRLLDVEAEMESSLNRLFAGLGVTREILTGEGTYAGNRISLEIMNTQYLLFREVLQDYVENNLFKPIAKKKGFIEYDDYGNEIILYPRLSFTRLAIRDNEQFFDSAFQLYQKGSISVDLILDILNIDSDSTKEKIEKDLFTVNDSLFNEMMRNLYTSVAAPLVETTDVTQKIADYLNLTVKPPEEGGAGEEGASRFSSDDKHRKNLAKVLKYLDKNPGKLEEIFKQKIKDS